jgi:hypothetical protein
MSPSPSLGPPLLSESWSPPFACGIPAVAPLGAEAAGALAAVAAPAVEPDGGCAALEWLFVPPQPATSSATTTLAVASNTDSLRLIDPDIAITRFRRW